MLRHRYLFLLAVLLAGLCYVFNTRSYFKPDVLGIVPLSLQQHRVNRERKGIISTEGCKIPDLNPMDPYIKDYVEYPSDMPTCRNSTLLKNNKTMIWVTSEFFDEFNISAGDVIGCCYQGFYRPAKIEDIESSYVDDRVEYEDCVKFNDTIKVKHEFVRVKCAVNDKSTYDQYFLFTPEKKFHRHGDIDEITNKTGYNVLIVGVDSVSRLNFIRTMPKMTNFLNTRGAVDMLGYNKVGYNTFPNLVPMLLGVKDTEVNKLCYPYTEITFDNCPFVWEWYKQAGYYTAYAEECAHISTFNYAKSGFGRSPTDYYPRTLFREAERNVGRCGKLCMNNIYYYKVLLNYMEDLTWRLKSKRLFGLFWENSVSHDDLNWPMKMDEDYVQTFVNLEVSGYLNETIVFFLSDHGIRWGPIRSTKQGHIEERLPFLYVLTPKSFQENYKKAYENLMINSHRLTTPFDVYETLSDLINLNKINDSVISERHSKSYALKRGISLFLPVPTNRTCKAADIDDQWCTCLRDVSLEKDDPKAVEAAENLVKMINFSLKDHTQCAQLLLTDVVDAAEVQVGKMDKEDNPWREFMVVLRTAPSGGVFEATLRYHIKDQSWQLAGAPSRLNIYGKQSWCIDDYKLKPYCYCK